MGKQIRKIKIQVLRHFEKSKLDSNVDILSPIEARLLNYDLIIVSSLNENDFPQIDNHGWIGAKIKKDLGVNKTLKKIGQNGFARSCKPSQISKIITDADIDPDLRKAFEDQGVEIIVCN